MTTSAIQEARRSAGALNGRRALRAALLGVSLSTLMLAGVRAETPAGLGDAAAALSGEPAAAPTVAPDADRPETTGSVDAADPVAAEAPAQAATSPAEAPAPAEAVAPAETAAPAVAPAAIPAAPAAAAIAPAVDPLTSAVTALLATNGAGSSLKLPAADRAALITFYAARSGAPVWISGDAFNSAADAARARIAAADDDGLDAKRFVLPTAPESAEPAVLARAEVTLSAAALAYARQAWGGRVNPMTISRSITVGTPPFDADAALVALAASPDVAVTLDGFNPSHPQFLALRKLLAAARAEKAEAATPHPIIAEGKLLKPGVTDDRVPALRARLGLPERDGDTTYDDELAAAVSAFQKDKKLGVSGLANRQTLRVLNADARGASDQSALIAANMERWRWMPRDLGVKHVFVDLPTFHLQIMENGRETYETRVIIGKATNQTPVLSSAINQVVVNPYWNVPVSIAMNEMSGGSLRGFEVVDSRGKVVDSSAVSWDAVRAGKMRIRQAPGERNALGHIKFLFPNRYAVYLHDTPSRKLFANDFRALSHGCVRVDRPLEFADALTGDQGLSGAKLEKMVGGKERGLPVATTIPVHITYFTAMTRADGSLEARHDIYGLDGRLKAALAGETLPALPPEPVIASRRAPKPERRQTTATREAPPEPVIDQRAQRPDGFQSWLSRVFGDSRQRP